MNIFKWLTIPSCTEDVKAYETWTVRWQSSLNT